VSENIFGDIISDMAAALVGGMGMAPSGDIGYEHGMFQPAHGSAPTIAGKNIANPVATILSGAMMCDWLSDRCNDKAIGEAGSLIWKAVEAVLADGHLTGDVGGSTGTREFGDFTVAKIRELTA